MSWNLFEVITLIKEITALLMYWKKSFY